MKVRSQSKASEEQSKKELKQGKHETTNHTHGHQKKTLGKPTKTNNHQKPKAQAKKTTKNQAHHPQQSTPAQETHEPTKPQSHPSQNNSPSPQTAPEAATAQKSPRPTQSLTPLPIAVLFFPFLFSPVMRAFLPGGRGARHLPGIRSLCFGTP